MDQKSEYFGNGQSNYPCSSWKSLVFGSNQSQRKKIRILRSVGRRKWRFYEGLEFSLKFQKMRTYLKEEYKSKNNSEMNLSEWTEYCPEDIPHQRNGYDCGVFTCKYADYIAKEESFRFSQKNMPYFRKRIVLDILNKQYSC